LKSFSVFLLIVFVCAATARAANSGRVDGQLNEPQDLVASQEKAPVNISDEAYPPELSGTVADTSGAVIAGATVQVRSSNGTVQRTRQSDKNGAFTISGLAAGNYRLVVSNPDFETKEMPVTIGSTRAPVPLRISLAVRAVSTTINVQGREDDLIGIANSATQGTVGAKEIQDRPILRSGEILETVPVSSSLNTPVAERPTNIFCVDSISTTVQISPFSLTMCRLTCHRTRTARGMRT
jgi:Carboxypeptidase regulatory-like domain